MSFQGTKRGRRLHGPSTSVLAALLLASCAVGPNFRAPAPPASPRYTPEPLPQRTAEAAGQAGAAQSFAPDAPLPADWWTLFGSGPLNEAVVDALRNSPSIDAAGAALRSAEANYAATRGALLIPHVDGAAQVTRQKVPGAAFGLPSVPASLYTLYAASVSVSYRLDPWGGARRALEAAGAQREYQQWELEAARLSLGGNLVTSAVSVGSLRAQLEAVADIVAAERSQLQVIERQFAVGAVARGDVLAQRAQLAQTEASLPALEKALAQSRHRLSVLAGHRPDEPVLADFDLDALTLPRTLPLNVPAELVRRRPDVKAAEALLHAATAQLGVATANMLPQLTLTGQVASDSVATRDWFGPGTGAWSLAAGLTQPLFHGGELWSRRREARANLEQTAAQYRQVVLAALQEVADALRALETDARALAAQAAAESAARDSLELTRRQYQAGGVSYVALLVAERQYLQARQSRVQAEGTRYADTVALFQALGGGWWNRPAGGLQELSP